MTQSFEHNIYRVNTTTFMFIDLSKTNLFFLSSLTVHLPAYCHSISVCLVITWEICVSVSTVLLIRFRLGIAGFWLWSEGFGVCDQCKCSWMQSSEKTKTNKTLLTLKVVMLCTGCVLIDWKICLNSGLTAEFTMKGKKCEKNQRSKIKKYKWWLEWTVLVVLNIWFLCMFSLL